MYTVPGPVSGLSATTGVTKLTFSWTPSLEPNGVIIAYEVCTNSSGVFSYTNTSATQHRLRDLPPNTVVTFSVRAYTIIGPGEYVTGQVSTAMKVSVSFFFHVSQSFKVFIQHTYLHVAVAVVNDRGHGRQPWLWSMTIAMVMAAFVADKKLL